MPPPPWGREMDGNLLHERGAAPAPAAVLQRESGRDEHSLVADAQFVDPETGDYRVQKGSPALSLGFVNFPMDQFGVQDPELKSIARNPKFTENRSAAPTGRRDSAPSSWFGASVRNIADEGEMSAFGLPTVTGVLILGIPSGSTLAKSGLQKNDVILSVNGATTADVAALLRKTSALIEKQQPFIIGVSRNQTRVAIALGPPR